MTELQSERLLLRRWRQSDRVPFRELNADPQVTEHFPGPLSAAESDAMVERIESAFEQQGYGLWALELVSSGEFIGFTGLSHPRFEAPFTPATEVGWRLARSAWGQGYAFEAARAAVQFGFEVLAAPEIVSFTTTGNLRSRAVMKRLGMTHDPADDFDHPLLPQWPHKRHVLYRLRPVRR